MILFLDYDGVLHPDPCFDPARMFAFAPRLALCLAEFPEVDIVLSTSWRHEKPLDDLVAPLLPAMQSRVVGITPHFGDFRPAPHLTPYRREAECVQWLVSHGAADREWVALDDRPSLFTPRCERLIECDSAFGFDARAAGRLQFAFARARRKMLHRIDAVLDL